jgi:glutamate dehydrogenase
MSTPVNGGPTPPENKLLNQLGQSTQRNPSPLPTHLSLPGSGHSTPRVLPSEGTAGSGYVAPTFEGKEKQMEEVMDGIEEKGFLPSEFVETETSWFYNELGIDDMYFATETVDT